MPEVLHLPESYLRMVHKILREYLPEAEEWTYGRRVNGDYLASDLKLVDWRVFMSRFTMKSKPTMWWCISRAVDTAKN